MSTRSYFDHAAATARAGPSGDAPGAMGLVGALLVGAFCAVVAANAHAALYKWTDGRGVVHYSDQLPPDAVNRASTELNRQGLTVRKTEQARAVAIETARIAFAPRRPLFSVPSSSIIFWSRVR